MEVILQTGVQNHSSAHQDSCSGVFSIGVYILLLIQKVSTFARNKVCRIL